MKLEELSIEPERKRLSKMAVPSRTLTLDVPSTFSVDTEILISIIDSESVYIIWPSSSTRSNFSGFGSN